MRGMTPELRRLLESGVQAVGFELVDAKMSGGHNVLLRVYIDSPNGVSVDDCADVSHQLSTLLDVEDPFPASYTLEVSSPGLDRPLVKPEDFDRFKGETIKVKLHRPLEGRRNFKGRLLGLADGNVILELDGGKVNLALADIDKTRLVPKV